MRERVRRHGSLPSAVDRFRDQPGTTTWYRHEYVRLAIDDITKSIAPNTYLTLIGERAKREDSPFVTVGSWEGGPFCSVRMESAARPADAFAAVIGVAAHERAHARWSPAAYAVCFPHGVQSLPEDTPALQRLRQR